MHLYRKGKIIGILVLLAGLFSQVSSHAQRQPVITAAPLIGDSVKAGKTLTVQDTVYLNTDLRTHIAQTGNFDNIVSLYIDEYSNHVLPDTFHVELRMRVHYALANEDTASRLDTLRIFYSKDHPHDSKDSKFYNDYYSAQVEVLDVSITAAPADSVRRFLVLENMIVMDRFFFSDCHQVSGVSHSTDLIDTDGELEVSWSAVGFIPSYELEWTYIDESALDAGNYNTDDELDPELIFKNNATRVQITGRNYRIPLLYDGDGTLFYRVRTLQNAPDGEVIHGQWSDINTGTGSGAYEFTGHERKLNWQATTSFAEEGKRKSVVQYFDGSLKGRQTVTKDNTTGTTVVAETLYDKQGRPVIQVLPAPTLSKLIAYTPLINARGINTAEYDKSVYDTLLTDDDYCGVSADSMSSTSGAAQYYSPLNPLIDTEDPDYHQYVPNAFGYPFAETRYTRDNTGRIDKQGGVGPGFQIGSGYETKYFYGTPEQKDLDALFGTEVGDFSHYEKNMVRDANGQYSVSYVDMHGRTVATALTGRPPTSLQRLPTQDSLMQTDNLLTPVNNIIKENMIRSTSSILVPVKGDYTFNYSITPESLSLQDCKSTTVCYDCLYDLTITINDNCNNQQFGGSPYKVTLKNFSLFKADSTTYDIDTTCTEATAINTEFTVLLEEGSYDVTKELSLSKAGMQYYRDSIYVPHNTCKSYYDLVLEQLDSLRNRIDCTPDSIITNLTAAWRDRMMADLTPTTGQYADTSYLSKWYSIFDTYLSGNYQYQRPEVGQFLDEAGNPATVSVYNATSGSWTEVNPKNLSPEDFIANFRDSWAEALLPLHPEYRLLLEYEKLKSAYNWESDFFTTDTYAEAVAKGFLNPTGSSTAPASNFTVSGKTDSLFLDLTNAYGSSVAASAKTALENKMFQYLTFDEDQHYSLWGTVTGIVKCNSTDLDCHNLWNENENVFNTGEMCTGDLDQAWRMFRAIYLEMREDWIDAYLRQRTGIYASQFREPLAPVFPDRDITAFPTFVDDSHETYGGYNGTEDDATTAANNLNAFYLANCKAYAERWWQELAPCGYSETDRDTIINRLVRVAYEGADKDHPFGSSTVKPSSTSPYRSFEQVINEYNAENYPLMDPLACNAYLITNPKPYDQPGGLIVNKPLLTAPDSCSCAKINQFYTNFLGQQLRYGTFSNYMLQAQGTRITEGALDSLRNLCNNASSCTYLEQPIILPPALQCGTGDVCVGCQQVRAWYDSFTVKFDTIPTFDDTDSAQAHINQLFANYMNAHLGFSKQHTEYLNFLETCGLDTTAIDSIGFTPCDSTCWTVYHSGSGFHIKDDLLTNAYNNVVSDSLLFGGGLFHSPAGFSGSHYVLVNKCDSLNAGTDTVLMQWRVKPLYTSQAINPFALRGSNATYFGAEWRKDPADSNWWIGSTLLDGPDGNIIKGIGIQADSNRLQVDWVRITTKDTSSVLYFEGFTFTQGSCDSVGPLLCGRQAMDSTIVLNMSPCADTSFYAQEAATYFFDIYHEKLKGEFEKAYTSKCMDAGKLETFTVTHQLMEYHYTLYYYDQAGNLIKTVPPEGVDIHRDDEWMEEVEQAREEGEVLVPDHRLATTYRYNSRNQVISQHSPDGGFSRFWYDRLGRLVISQNAQQALDGNYSYTLYDQLGRITEVGQKKQETAMTDAIARNRGDLDDWLNETYTVGGNELVAEQVTRTVYDERDPQTSTLENTGYIVNETFQKSYTLRNRVSYTRYYDQLKWGEGGKQVSQYDNSTTYSYDIHGNVDTLLHDFRTGIMNDHGLNRHKAMAYKYDLISGKVNEVHYQPGWPDQFYHRYEYDADNKLTDVFTTDKKPSIGIPALEEHEARYSYYKHGPLARTVLGQEQVQGIDYTYTLQGWLKGVNSDSLLDKDGLPGMDVAKDAYRFSLNYFNGDYTAIGNAVAGKVFPGHSAYMENASAGDYKPLYNGNISSMVVGIPQLGEMKLYNYGYDQLNRIVSMDTWRGYNSAEGNWNDIQKIDDYRERISYDANGNIKTYQRNGVGSTQAMDDLTYGYNKDGNDNIINNRLRHVKDAVSDGNYTEDIDNQDDDNYEYDAIGNLTKDTKEGISTISWTVYGKIKKITKTDGTLINYTYDVAGNRISKAVTKDDVTTTTWYSRDAQGNPLAIYTGTATSLVLSEQPLYGSSRLGVWNRSVDMDAPFTENNNTFVRGNKIFELSNHLGSVLVTISDKKIGIDGNSDGTIDYYTADVLSAQDYYPFGELEPGRQYGTLGRYGFNGKEQDPETKGTGAQYDYGFRIYDPRIGRFLSVDPLAEKYPFYSPYQFASNNPTFAVDIDGLEADKILNKAESLLSTPYEYGGKNPASELIGSLGNDDGKRFWETSLRPALRLISDYHPDHYKTGKGEICTPVDKTKQWQGVVAGIYKQFSSLSQKGSLGIDCSGFVCASYLQDQELLFDAKTLRTGSSGQLAVFNKAAKEGKAYVHKDFNLLSAGDFIKKPGHVMIATGNVKLDKKGNVSEFETYEANSTDVGSVTMWRKVNSSYTIGHPFRTSDTGGTSFYGGWGRIRFFKLPTPSSDPKTRTKDNLQQTVVEDKKTP